MLRYSARLGALCLAVLSGCNGSMSGDETATAMSAVTYESTACKVVYTVSSQWGGGFGAGIQITNKGGDLNGWTLEWDWPSGQTITQAWNAATKQTSAHVVATSVSYNGSLAAGGTVTFGFNGAFPATNTAPVSFSLNGVSCSGTVTGSGGAVAGSGGKGSGGAGSGGAPGAGGAQTGAGGAQTGAGGAQTGAGGAQTGAGGSTVSTCKTVSGGQSGNFDTTGAFCFQTSDNIQGWGCSNMTGRTLTVNGTAVSCGAMPLPAKVNGFYVFQASAGGVSYASVYWWGTPATGSGGTQTGAGGAQTGSGGAMSGSGGRGSGGSGSGGSGSGGSGSGGSGSGGSGSGGAATGKTFNQCRFHFGTIDSVARAAGSSMISQLDFFTPGWMLGSSFDQSYVCSEGNSGGALANQVPVIVAYVAAGNVKRDHNLCDCNVSGCAGGDLCKYGAQYIVQDWTKIVNAYKSYSAGYAACYGTTRPIIFEMEPDWYQYTGSGQTQPWTAAQAGARMAELVAALRSSLPNARFSMDVSPWVAPNNGSDNGAQWFSNFNMSLFTFVNTSGGGTNANTTKIRSSNNMTWSGLSSVTGKPILADTGYGANGAPAGHDAAWDVPANINARIADGVISIAQYNPVSSWGSTISSIRGQLNAPRSCP